MEFENTGLRRRFPKSINFEFSHHFVTQRTADFLKAQDGEPNTLQVQHGRFLPEQFTDRANKFRELRLISCEGKNRRRREH
jgi:hypothetical protein